MDSSCFMAFIGYDHNLRINDEWMEFKYSGGDEEADTKHQVAWQETHDNSMRRLHIPLDEALD